MIRTATAALILAAALAGCSSTSSSDGPTTLGQLAKAVGCTTVTPVDVAGGTEHHCTLPGGPEVDLVKFTDEGTADAFTHAAAGVLTAHKVTPTLYVLGAPTAVKIATRRL